jgi:RNA polymerase-binding transcription factor DksA
MSVPVSHFSASHWLDRRADELERSVSQALSHLGDDLRDVLDTKDTANERLLTTVDNAALARDLAELRADGRYGLCMQCGCAIDAARLAVQPAAERCAACQTEAEHAPLPRRD